MTEITIGQKWVTFQDVLIYDGFGDVVHGFKNGDIITIVNIQLELPYPFGTNTQFSNDMLVPLTKAEIIDNFMLLAEWRELQINSILND